MAHQSLIDSAKVAPTKQNRGSPQSARRIAGEARAAETVSAAERECLVATAAYYRAGRRGFAPGQELEDWLEAEREIERQLGSD